MPERTLAGKRIVVVGAGIAGLSAALELLQIAPDADVLVLERNQRAGGLIETDRARAGFVVEQGPDSLVTWKPSSLEAVHRAGLDHAIVTGTDVPRRAFVVQQGALVPMPDGLMSGVPTAAAPLFRSPLLSFGAKLRLAIEPLVGAKYSEEDESVATFVTRRFGPEVLNHVVAPLVAGIYGADATRLSMLSSMPQLAALEREYGSIAWGLYRTRNRRKASKPQVASLAGGMDTLTTALAEQLGTRLRLGAGIDEVRECGPRRWTLTGEAFSIEADALVLATPAHVSARLLSAVDADLAQLLDGIKHGPLCTLSMAFKADELPALVPGTGFIVPNTENRATTACSFMSQKWPGRAPVGTMLMRSFVSLPAAATDQEVIGAALTDIRDLLGIEQRPLWTQLVRRPLGLPRYEVGHADKTLRMEALAARHHSIALAGNALRGIGIAECIDSGRLAARTVAAALHTDS